MEYRIKGLQPEALFRFFEDISAIPRGSHNEKAISDYLVSFAKERGLWVNQDAANNVIIKKPASAGAENTAPVMLQGHLDMVCEKLAGVEHDFETEGLDLIVEDGVLRANGTTLGGDNGAAVALMMTVLDDDTLRHPPLECVFTVCEEVGLDGAKALDKSQLDSRTMINLDSEEEGVATVSCAGGMRYALVRPAQREEAHGFPVSLEIRGLLGGHSGSDIHKERRNGVKLMARVLRHLTAGKDCRLMAFDGGSKDNAIPRECSASVLYLNREEAQKARRGRGGAGLSSAHPPGRTSPGKRRVPGSQRRAGAQSQAGQLCGDFPEPGCCALRRRAAGAGVCSPQQRGVFAGGDGGGPGPAGGDLRLHHGDHRPVSRLGLCGALSHPGCVL